MITVWVNDNPRALTMGDVEAERTGVEGEGAIEVSDAKADVTDFDARIERLHGSSSCTSQGRNQAPLSTRPGQPSPASRPRTIVRKPRPCIRGCTAVTNHASKTRCRNTFDPMGEIPPPCGVPLSGELSAPASSTPAWSHLPIRRTIPPSFTLC